MNFEIVTGILALLGLLVLGVFSLFGYVNITLAIVFTGLYIGSSVWLGFVKIAEKIK